MAEFQYSISERASHINGIKTPIYLEIDPSDSHIDRAVNWTFAYAFVFSILYFENAYIGLAYTFILCCQLKMMKDRSTKFFFSAFALILGHLCFKHVLQDEWFNLKTNYLSRMEGFHSFLPLGLIIFFLLPMNKESHEDTIVFLKRVNSVINHLLFNKSEIFRNSPKWDLISFKLIFPSAFMFYVLSILLGIDFSKEIKMGSTEIYILGAVGSNFIASFIHLNAAKAAKYKKVLDSYEKILEFRSTRNTKFSEVHIWEVSTAIDILHFDMWAHKSFREFFAYHLNQSMQELRKQRAILEMNRDKHALILSLIDSDFQNQINSGRLNVKDAGIILDYCFQLRCHAYFSGDGQGPQSVDLAA